MAQETFGSVLKQLMLEKGITQASLARSVGCDRTTIGDYTRDKYLPKEETFHRIHQVIPDKKLYDAFFAATKPKDRKNKPLIKEEKKTYNYYSAKEERASDFSKFIDVLINSNKKSSNSTTESNRQEVKSNNATRTSDIENKYIAHALLYITSMFEEEGLMALAPTDYMEYKKLYEKYEQYVDVEPFM